MLDQQKFLDWLKMQPDSAPLWQKEGCALERCFDIKAGFLHYSASGFSSKMMPIWAQQVAKATAKHGMANAKMSDIKAWAKENLDG